MFLSRFDFTLKYIPGSKMAKANGLSRRLDWHKGVEKGNKNRMLVKPEWLGKVQVEKVLIKGVDILEKIRKSKTKDNEVVKAVEEMKKIGVKMLRDKE